MRIISRRCLQNCAAKHPNARAPLDAWFQVVRRASWKNHQDLREQFRAASIVRECVVFNIGGSKFRLVAWINYRAAIVYVKAVYKHEEYDRVELDCRKQG